MHFEFQLINMSFSCQLNNLLVMLRLWTMAVYNMYMIWTCPVFLFDLWPKFV